MRTVSLGSRDDGSVQFDGIDLREAHTQHSQTRSRQLTGHASTTRQQQRLSTAKPVPAFPCAQLRAGRMLAVTHTSGGKRGQHLTACVQREIGMSTYQRSDSLRSQLSTARSTRPLLRAALAPLSAAVWRTDQGPAASRCVPVPRGCVGMCVRLRTPPLTWAQLAQVARNRQQMAPACQASHRRWVPRKTGRAAYTPL